jgi:hypothetical protein
VTTVKVAWARWGGRLVHISEFRPLQGTRTERPLMDCLGCDEPVFPVVGPKRSHHFRHDRESMNCAVAEGEGARHLNTKLGVAEKLRRLLAAGTAPVVARYCDPHRANATPAPLLASCPAMTPWSSGATRVEVEFEQDRLRPDVALLCGEDIVLAIEIRVTNPIHPSKQQDYWLRGIPWLELDVRDDVVYEQVQAWSLDDDPHIPWTHHSVDLAWRCEDHATTRAPLFFKFVDCYYPNGTHDRVILWVERQWTHGELTAHRLFWGTNATEPFATLDAATSVGAAVTAFLDKREPPEGFGIIHDVFPMWLHVENFRPDQRLRAMKQLASRYDLYPRRYALDPASQNTTVLHWRRIEPAWDPKMFTPDEIEVMARISGALIFGQDPASIEKVLHPVRQPYSVPVASRRLRAAWLGEAVALRFLDHCSGERLIPGVPAMTVEELRRLMRDGTPPAALPPQPAEKP